LSYPKSETHVLFFVQKDRFWWLLIGSIWVGYSNSLKIELRGVGRKMNDGADINRFVAAIFDTYYGAALDLAN